MSQRLIYGKTVRIKADALTLDAEELDLITKDLSLTSTGIVTIQAPSIALVGQVFMDPYDATGTYPPISFNDTARASFILTPTGQTGTTTVTVIGERNNGQARLLIACRDVAIISNAATMTMQLPAGCPFIPTVLTNFLVDLYNNTTAIPDSSMRGTISTTGLITFLGIVSGNSYAFRYGLTTNLYVV